MGKKIILYLFLLGTFSTYSAQVLIWDHDNDAAVSHTDSRKWVGTEKPVYDALRRLGHDVNIVRRLPSELHEYKVVFITLGYLAPS
ncbi:hypothetical protein KAR48_16965 [bacterium]|nr:hypothetical protein [bacterium]